MSSRRPLEDRLRHDLRGMRAPDETGTADRVLANVLAAHAARSPARRPRRWGTAAAAVAATVLLVSLAGALTRPGQAVGDWLRDVVQPRPVATPTAAPQVSLLPAPGRVLARRDGIAVVADRRPPSRLGDYGDATWSPRGRFAAVTTPRALVAVTPAGAIRWRVVPPAAPRRPAWSPDGVRIAYLAGRQLRVVVADGTDDRLFFGHVRDVGPAFRPSAGRTIAWVDEAGHARVADVDRARLLWRSAARVPAGAHALSWSPGGRRLLVAGTHRVAVFDLRAGMRVRRVRGRIAAAAFPPAGAGPPALMVRRGGRSALRLLGRRAALLETSGRYRGLTWSPDGRWLLTEFGDRWLLVRRDGQRLRSAPDRGRPLAWAR